MKRKRRYRLVLLLLLLGLAGWAWFQLTREVTHEDLKVAIDGTRADVLGKLDEVVVNQLQLLDQQRQLLAQGKSAEADRARVLAQQNQLAAAQLLALDKLEEVLSIVRPVPPSDGLKPHAEE